MYIYHFSNPPPTYATSKRNIDLTQLNQKLLMFLRSNAYEYSCNSIHYKLLVYFQEHKDKALRLIEKGFATKYPTVDVNRQETTEISELMDKMSTLPYPAWQILIKYIRLLRIENKTAHIDEITYLKVQCLDIGLEFRPSTVMTLCKTKRRRKAAIIMEPDPEIRIAMKTLNKLCLTCNCFR